MRRRRVRSSRDIRYSPEISLPHQRMTDGNLDFFRILTPTDTGGGTQGSRLPVTAIRSTYFVTVRGAVPACAYCTILYAHAQRHAPALDALAHALATPWPHPLLALLPHPGPAPGVDATDGGHHRPNQTTPYLYYAGVPGVQRERHRRCNISWRPDIGYRAVRGRALLPVLHLTCIERGTTDAQ